MAKNVTWDTKAVMAAVGRVKGAAFRWAAQDIQRTAKRSMKRKKNFRDNAPPGVAPHAHEGGLKNSLRYAWDNKRQSVVVGPVQYKGRYEGARALEYGGTVKITVKRPVETKTVKERKSRGASTYRPVATRSEKEQTAIKDYYNNIVRRPYKDVTMTVNMPARPFMVPAMKKELKKMRSLLKRAAKKFK